MPEDPEAPRAFTDPERIDHGHGCVATLHQGRHYMVRFPYAPEATRRMNLVSGAIWAREMGGWIVPSVRASQIDAALRDISAMPAVREKAAREMSSASRRNPERRDEEPLEKIVVAESDGVNPGDILETKKGPRIVERLGVSFLGPAWLGKRGRRELVGEPVRYAWSRPATEAELEARRAAVTEADETPSP
jgi:hypothetical protein